MTRGEVLDRLARDADGIRRRFGVRDLALFGSMARDEADSSSDVDILVTFDGRPDFDRYMDLRFHLEELLGRRIDLVTRAALRPELRDRIEREAVLVP